MTEYFDWGDFARGGMGNSAEALSGVDDLLSHPKCAGRAVEYRIQGARTLQRSELEQWMLEGERLGYSEIHYSVNPLDYGPVAVEVWASDPSGAKTFG